MEITGMLRRLEARARRVRRPSSGRLTLEQRLSRLEARGNRRRPKRGARALADRLAALSRRAQRGRRRS